METPILETERLLLRELTPDDFDAVHAYGSDPEVVEYVPWGPNTEQETRDFLARHVSEAQNDRRTEYVFAVIRKDDDLLLGCVGVHLPEADAHQAMLGYAYRREAWGQGYATEAARVMVEMAFDVLGLRRVWAGCDPDNLASARVLDKLGMELEGHLREDMMVRGEVRDSLVWAILRDDWERTEEEDE